MNGMTKQGGLGRGLLGPALIGGAAWGLGEATLGHLLHLARVPGLPGLVMIPFAVLVMGRTAAAARSNTGGAVFLAGLTAASLKLLDLAVPGTDILSLVNPIRAILLEALAGAFWVKAVEMGAEKVFEKHSSRIFRRSPVPCISTGLPPSAHIRSLPSDGRP